MNRSLFSPVLIAAAFLCLLFPCMATADPVPIIHYQATNVSGDLWQYDYFLSYANAGTFSQNQAFAILFDESLYSNLQDPPPSVTDWNAFVFQPDPSIPAPGEYDALALVDNPSIAGEFSLTFQWLGGAGTAPGSQPFIVNEFDQNGDFVREIGTGETISENVVPTVPEPSSLLLLASGLIVGAIVRRKLS